MKTGSVPTRASVPAGRLVTLPAETSPNWAGPVGASVHEVASAHAPPVRTCRKVRLVSTGMVFLSVLMSRGVDAWPDLADRGPEGQSISRQGHLPRARSQERGEVTRSDESARFLRRPDDQPAVLCAKNL